MRMLCGTILAAVVALSAHGAIPSGAAAPSCDGMPRENEKKAYGELANNIVARLELWPGLAPHETTRERGRFVFDENTAVWRPQGVTSPDVILLKPSEVRHDTLVMA